jgi:hypothetical protein
MAVPMQKSGHLGEIKAKSQQVNQLPLKTNEITRLLYFPVRYARSRLGKKGLR